MSVGLWLELDVYVDELERINTECQRPRKVLNADGKEEEVPCVQCYERAFVISRLKDLLERYK